MAQELVINTWCDVCMGDGGRKEIGESHQVALQGHAPRVIDLCERHAKTLVGLLDEALGLYGRRPDGVPKRPYTKRATTQPAEGTTPSPRVPVQGGAQCLVCGHQAPTSSALGQHIKQAHGLSMTQMFGAACPLCGTELSATGMGMHLTKAHDVKGGMAAAFNVAREQGDPHGVVAVQDQLAAHA